MTNSMHLHLELNLDYDMDLRTLVDTEKYSGVLVLSDLHAVLSALTQATVYAKENNLFMLMLGDLVDGGSEPIECLNIIRNILNAEAGAMVIGNHDDKFYRYSIGNSVVLNKDQIDTLEIAEAMAPGALSELMIELISHRNSSYYFYYDKFLFAHASAHKSIWEYPEKIGRAQKAMCLYGEVDGTRDVNNLPNRTYRWVDDVPAGHSIVVGHARGALGKAHTLPLIVRNDNGGHAYFTDTSCGKGDGNNPLNGTVLSVYGDTLRFSNFVPFI